MQLSSTYSPLDRLSPTRQPIVVLQQPSRGFPNPAFLVTPRILWIYLCSAVAMLLLHLGDTLAASVWPWFMGGVRH